MSPIKDELRNFYIDQISVTKTFLPDLCTYEHNEKDNLYK